MKAIVCTRYGAPHHLQVRHVDVPIPEAEEILIKVYAGTVTAADSMMRRADPFITRLFLGLFRPRHSIMGTGFSGRVEAVGENVKLYKVGDEVFGETGVNFGANAEYVCMPQSGVLLHKPTMLSFEEAATLSDGPLTSYNFLKKLADIQPGQKVLINGASGSLGTAAVQIADQYGAEVTAVCSSKNAPWVKRLGAAEVIDYEKRDFTVESGKYDLIYDAIGKRTFGQCKQALKPGGTYLSPVLSFRMLLSVIGCKLWGSRIAIFSATGLLPPAKLRQYLQELLPMLKEGKLKVIIDRRYPLEQTAEGHRYVDTGRKKGNVVIVI